MRARQLPRLSRFRLWAQSRSALRRNGRTQTPSACRRVTMPGYCERLPGNSATGRASPFSTGTLQTCPRASTRTRFPGRANRGHIHRGLKRNAARAGMDAVGIQREMQFLRFVCGRVEQGEAVTVLKHDALAVRGRDTRCRNLCNASLPWFCRFSGPAGTGWQSRRVPIQNKSRRPPKRAWCQCRDRSSVS